MIKLAHAALAVALTFASNGCLVPALTTLDHKTRFDDTSPDAIVVIGFSDELNVWLSPGVDDGVNWHCRSGRKAVRRIRPEEGFVVARLPARTGKQKYAIIAIGTDLNLDVYRPVANTPVWVFNAEPGKVTYVGAVRVHWSDGGPAIVPDASVTQSSANDYVTRTFSNVPVHLVRGQLDQIYMSFDSPNGCVY